MIYYFTKFKIMQTLTQNSYHEMWLSLVERCVRDAEAAGSSPVISTILNLSNQTVSEVLALPKKVQKTILTTYFYLQLWDKVLFFISTVSKFNTPKSCGTDFLCPRHLCYYVFLSFAFCPTISAFISFISFFV